MEFYLTLAALYTAQCLLDLDKGETLGLRWRFPPDPNKGRTRLIRGGGWRLVHPWPAAFVFSGRSEIPHDRPPSDVSALRDTIQAACRRTRALRWLGSFQLVWILLLGPLGALVVGPEASILVGMGPALGFHLIAIILLFRAQRFVLPDDSNRGERLMIAALYPPALIRSGAELVRLAGADRQIAELASVVLSDVDFERLIRSEIGRAKSPLHAPTSMENDIEWLHAVAAQRSLAKETLQTPRARIDATAASYCEFCGGDYVAGYRFCRECQLTTTEYSLGESAQARALRAP